MIVMLEEAMMVELGEKEIKKEEGGLKGLGLGEGGKE